VKILANNTGNVFHYQPRLFYRDLAMYALPTSTFKVSLDPLSICSDQDTEVKHSDILHHLISKAAENIAENPNQFTGIFTGLVEDIAYSLHENGLLDTQRLKSFFNTTPSATAVVNILKAALELSKLVPLHQLETLQHHGQSAKFTGAESNALLAHMALGSVYPLEPRTPSGFTIWYSSEQASHDQAVDGYLRILFDHFSSPYTDSQAFEFHLFEFDDVLEVLQKDNTENPNTTPLTVEVVQEIRDPSNSIGSPFVLVAANKNPGVGVTGTQEERLQAASLAMSLSSLLCPSIPDGAVVITSAFPVHSSWTGHNRNTRLEILYPHLSRPNRRYILADALPLDDVILPLDKVGLESRIRDLEPEFLNREIGKLYSAFKGAQSLHQFATQDEVCIIEVPPWGCGAFGGNLVVKGLCMLLAASTLLKGSIRLFIPMEKEEEAIILINLLKSELVPADLLKILSSEAARTWEVKDLIKGIHQPSHNVQ
jgi:poly(ADP-ribose) glycohydrolase